MDRTEALAYIDQNPDFSVLVIGGGINGIGTYRDLALQGLDVLLVERDDFCSGASAASSHMAHGGVRYLENGEFRLVREAVQERNLLIENAPQYVKPLPTVIPMFKWFSGILNAPLKFLRVMDKPAERGALVIKIGLMLYDAYTRRQGTVPKHEFMLKQKALEEYPSLNPDVLCIARYFDGSISCPERLCVEILCDVGQSATHARAINYLKAVDIEAGAVVLRDKLTGEEYEIRSKLVINAAGPWIDFANQSLGHHTNFIGGTKGSHLILDNPELHAAIKGKEFFFENNDGRIVLIFPLEDKVLVGTSDLYIDDPDDACCTDEEVDYFIEMLKNVFPNIEVTQEQIVFHFSGVRPLPASDAATAAQVSRDHSIEILAPEGGRDFPIWSLVGGKWTSFRAFSEKVTDLALKFLGWDRYQSTHDLAIGGGCGYPRTEEARLAWLADLHDQSGLPLPRLETLFDRYGTRAAEIAHFIAAGTDWPFDNQSSYSHYEIAYLARQEMIVHLDDLLLRRSLLAMLGQLSRPFLGELATVVGEELGWSDEQKDAELQRTLGILEERHGVRLA
ncbi:MAG: glycerol-3-phosphate dehydrogenase/oxidase [Chloroflexota bacterium]|nr:glycerol-3-phosphate dehydrogenase/oxidase [Chloroflexota bacterium]